MSTEQQKIELLIHRIVEYVNWGELDQWTHSHFENLSQKIFEKTTINISSRTLKRFLWQRTNEKSVPASDGNKKCPCSIYWL